MFKQLQSKSCGHGHPLNPEKALEAPGFAGLEERRVHSWQWTDLLLQCGFSYRADLPWWL